MILTAHHGARGRLSLALVLTFIATAVLQGCTASTQLIENEELSADVKAKGFAAYKEILLIPPKSDPRNVVPRVVTEFEGMGFKVRLMDPEKPLEAAEGTGFVIGADGHVLTAAHVLDEETEATVIIGGRRLFADVVRSDKEADLALLKLREPLPPEAVVLAFRPPERSATMGEDVFTIGYPLSRILGSGARMSRGLVSATTGVRDDPDEMQVSAEIQPGNSGGPLLDRDGQVIGVIQKTINPWRVAQDTGGALPQNVNFALKGSPALDFVREASPAAAEALAPPAAMGLDQAGKGVAKILAGAVSEDEGRASKMVVRFSYESLWDVWYRFRLFALTAFDFESQERLFSAGQGRDNLVSNEEVVIKDTFAQFRKALGIP